MKTSRMTLGVVGAVILSPLWVLSQAPAPAAATGGTGAAAPKIAFALTTYDFGTVHAGDPVRHEFIFTNTGAGTLEIKDVRPGCGCTTAGDWDKKVEPGKTGKIPLQFNSTGFGGKVTKQATVTCNDPAQQTLTLLITGTVWKPIEIIPTMATFNFQTEDQSNQTKVVRISNHTEEMITLTDAQSPNPAFKTELKTLTPGKEFELLVTAVPPFTTPSAFASISIKTSSAKTPVLNVSAYVMVQRQVMVMPEQLTLPPGPLTNAVTLTATVRNTSTNVFALSDAHVNVPGVDVRVQQVQTNKLISLRVTFPAGFQVKPDQKVELSAKSTHPKFAVLHIPVNQAPVPAISPARIFPPPAPRAVTNAQALPRPVPGRSPLPDVPKN